MQWNSWDTVDWRQMCPVEWGEVEVSQNVLGGLEVGELRWDTGRCGGVT